MVNRNRALELAGRLVVAFPGRNVTEEHAQAWANAIEPLPNADADRVITLLLHRSVDPPAVAQINQTIAEVQGVTMSPDYYGGGWRCTFLDNVDCPRCSTPERPIMHGRLLTRGDLGERLKDFTVLPVEVCPACDVVHKRLTHDEYVKRTARAFEMAQVGKERG